ncbi:uncharacterized TPR repeat-containing protein-like protein [Tanacetum coccineum]
MFQRFDINEEGGLDKEELGRLLLSKNDPRVKAREELGSYVDKVSVESYGKYEVEAMSFEPVRGQWSSCSC